MTTEKKTTNKFILSDEFKKSEAYRELFGNRKMRQLLSESFYTKEQKELRKAYRISRENAIKKYNATNDKLLSYEELLECLTANDYFIEDQGK